MLRILLFISLCATVFFVFFDDAISHDPGITAPDAPIQSPAPAGKIFLLEDYLIEPLATFEVHARVLSRERYFLGRETDLSRFDLALGWGQMSDERILSHFSISQSNRWYRWLAKDLPIPRQEVIRSSANMHMVPADKFIERQIKRVRTGSIVKFEGYLIEARGEDGWKWRSSLSREDSGDKACEVVYVQHFEIIE